MRKAIILAVLLPFLLIGLQSCKKEAGSGGTSSIWGKVKVKDYNDTFTTLLEEYYAQDIDVFIIYGDDKSYSDHNRTGYDGTYEFKYLRPGNYKIYVYSKDSSLQTNAMIPIIREVTISKGKEEVEVPEITIFD